MKPIRILLTDEQSEQLKAIPHDAPIWFACGRASFPDNQHLALHLVEAKDINAVNKAAAVAQGLLGTRKKAPTDLPDKIAQSLATLADSDPRHVEGKHPQEAARALEMLSQGTSLASIEKITGLSITSISRMRRSHAEVLGEMRSRAAVDAAQTAEAYRLLHERQGRGPRLQPRTARQDQPAAISGGLRGGD